MARHRTALSNDVAVKTSMKVDADISAKLDLIVSALRADPGDLPYAPAKMVLAGRLIERGWLIARRDNMDLVPRDAVDPKTLLIQVDRRLWGHLKGQYSVTGMAVNALANMYLQLGINWARDDLPLLLTKTGYEKEFRAAFRDAGFRDGGRQS